MRGLLVVFGLLVAALIVVAGPASAHADHDHGAAVAHHSDAPAPSHHSGDGADHNAADHSHPIGEDTYHEKASHSSLDFAHVSAVTVKLAQLPRPANLPVADEAAHGLALAPPIRPPLG
jgi:hypothetical protein